MKRDDVYREMKDILGAVPSFFKSLPDRALETEWRAFKIAQVDESPIPAKYRELIGVGISAVTKCRYCVYFHTEMARLFGATDAEIENAVHYAKSSAGWSAYINGLQTDYDQFRSEVQQICEHIRKQR